MLITHTKSGLREALGPWKDQTVALVPTMGALHDGHLALVETARREADRVVVSIFVNPLQFGPQEDLEKYPRTLEADRALLEQAGCDLLYAPSAEEMYGDGIQTHVEPGPLAEGFCGSSRPGHFRGVCTVVLKLFQQVQPDLALFGRKDAQQLRVLQCMAADLDLPIRVLAVDTVREEDGLALSSRNRYLSAEERRQGLVLHRALEKGREAYGAGQRNASVLSQAMAAEARREPAVEVEYLQAVHWHDLRPSTNLKPPLLLLGAIRVGTTRLIDNVFLDIN